MQSLRIKATAKVSFDDQFNSSCTINLYKHTDSAVDLASLSLSDTHTHSDTSPYTLALLGLPTSLSPQDLLRLIEPSTPTHIRLIKDSYPNKYVALISCGSDAVMHEMLARFSSMPCLNLTALVVSKITYGRSLVEPLISPDASIELPTCPVCLDRMDQEVTGTLSLICTHEFHSHCLSKWEDSSCPVCRFTHQNQTGKANACAGCEPSSCIISTAITSTISSIATEMSNDSESAGRDLWICLICGNVGCGRYTRGHAESHFLSTSHIFALEMCVYNFLSVIARETQRVWDYVRSGYVHRLLENKPDGKLVELKRTSGGSGGDEKNMQADLDVEMEYSCLLSRQMQAQREYYDGMIEEIHSEHAVECQTMHDEIRGLKTVGCESERRAAGQEKRLKKVLASFEALEKERAEDSILSAALVKNQEELKRGLVRHAAAVAVKDREIAELKEQVRDLMFFLESRDKCGGDSEMQGGDVAVAPMSNGKKKR